MNDNRYATPGARVSGARAIARQLGRVVTDTQRLRASVGVALEAIAEADASPLHAAEERLAEVLRERLGPALVGLESLAASLAAPAPAAAVARGAVAAQTVVDAVKACLLESAVLIETYQETWRGVGPRTELPMSAALESVRREHLEPALAAMAKLGRGWDRSPMARISPADVARARLFLRLRQQDEDQPELARCLERMKAERPPDRTEEQARLAEARITALETLIETKTPEYLAAVAAFVTSDERAPRGLRLSREAARKRFSPLRPPSEAVAGFPDPNSKGSDR